MAYSIDLRERAIAALESGMSKWKIHQTFKISRTTLDDWIKLKEKTGSLKQIQYQHGPKPSISNTAENHAFFEEHKYKTLAQLCALWFEKTGQKVSDVTMSKTLKRLDYTRKKRHVSTKNEMN